MNQEGNTTQLQALLDLAAEGNDEAYGELVSQASERLLKLTRKMIPGLPRLRRWEATDDVFQTTDSLHSASFAPSLPFSSASNMMPMWPAASEDALSDDPMPLGFEDGDLP